MGKKTAAMFWGEVRAERREVLVAQAEDALKSGNTKLSGILLKQAARCVRGGANNGRLKRELFGRAGSCLQCALGDV